MPQTTAQSAATLDSKLVERILAEVREDEIVSMASDVINIPSPTGEELQMAQYMQSTLQKIGLDVTWQEVEESRANVVGRWKGTGAGKNLMFNGHMDTSNTGREEFLTGRHIAAALTSIVTSATDRSAWRVPPRETPRSWYGRRLPSGANGWAGGNQDTSIHHSGRQRMASSQQRA